MIYIGDPNYDKKIIKYFKKLSKTKERWKTILINNEKSDYKISNLGRLYCKKTNKINDFSNWRFDTYQRVLLIHKNEPYKFSIHRLVAINFCQIPKRHKKQNLTFNDLYPNHKNGIKSHNASFNLEWVTPKENTDHAWKSGLCANIQGEKNHLALITEQTAIRICELIMERKSNMEIIEELGKDDIYCNISTVQHIRSGESWKHISNKYEFPKLSEGKHYSISLSTVHKICQLLEMKKYTNTEIAKICNVKREYVKDIKTHRRRKDISKYYNF